MKRRKSKGLMHGHGTELFVNSPSTVGRTRPRPSNPVQIAVANVRIGNRQATIAEVAALIGCSRFTLSRLMEKGNMAGAKGSWVKKLSKISGISMEILLS